MALIFPQVACSDVNDILLAMLKLKSQRYNQEISRHTFLLKWSVLRERLNATPEYQEMRLRVFRRAKGQCEKCRMNFGEHVCHKIAVAVRPEFALRMSNVYLGCFSCHQEDHPAIELSR